MNCLKCAHSGNELEMKSFFHCFYSLCFVLFDLFISIFEVTWFIGDGVELIEMGQLFVFQC